MDNVDNVKHVLGLSEVRIARLADYAGQLSQIDIEYFFTDTGEELEEVYEYLNMLEGYLGKSINYLDPERDFKFWMKQYNNFFLSSTTVVLLS